MASPRTIPPKAVQRGLPPKIRTSSPSSTYQTPLQIRTRPITIERFVARYRRVNLFFFMPLLFQKSPKILSALNLRLGSNNYRKQPVHLYFLWK